MQPYSYSKDANYEEVIEFLGSLYQQDKSHPYWLPGRWEYATFLVDPLHATRGKPSWQPTVTLWRESERIVAMTNSEGPDENYFVHISPAYRTKENVQTLVSSINYDPKKLTVWSLETDVRLNDALKIQGLSPHEPKEYLSWRNLSDPLPSRPNVSSEFVIREVTDNLLESHFSCTAAAFASQPVTLPVYRALQSAPTYRKDLDLVITKQEEVVSLCTVWFDENNQLGYIEPVATHPLHQGKGLGRAILWEALERLKTIGTKIAYVGAYGDDRMSFYNKCGFTERVALVPWSDKRSLQR